MVAVSLAECREGRLPGHLPQGACRIDQSTVEEHPSVSGGSGGAVGERHRDSAARERHRVNPAAAPGLRIAAPP